MMAYHEAEAILGAPVFYCEGWMVTEFDGGLRLPLEHSWLETMDVAIEPTLDPTVGLWHYPAFRLTIRETLDALETQGFVLPLLEFCQVCRC